MTDVLALHLARFPAAAGLVFHELDGRPLHRDLAGRAFRRAVVAAQAPAGTRLHDLRHYYASLLIRHGAAVKVIQARLGHAGAKETLDTYGHMWPDSEDLTRTALTRFSALVRTLCGLRRALDRIIAGQRTYGPANVTCGC